MSMKTRINKIKIKIMYYIVTTMKKNMILK